MSKTMNQYSLTAPAADAIISQALSILRPHLLSCISLYRRLQFGRFTSSSLLITNLDLSPLSSAGTIPSGKNGTQFPPGTTPATPANPFVISFIDRCTRPETECWLYGSWENESVAVLAPDNAAETSRLVRALVRAIQALPVPPSMHSPATTTRTEERPLADSKNFAQDLTRAEFSSHMHDAEIVLFGAVGERMVRSLVQEAGVMRVTGRGSATPNWGFVFDVDALEVDEELNGGMRWGEIRREDLGLVRSRTGIPRQEKTLAVLPSVAAFDGEKLMGWAFVGLDGELTSLHVEQEYRRKGLAKKISARLFRERMGRFWEEGVPRLAHGFVIDGNEASVAMCRSLGGREAGKSYWLRERFTLAQTT